MEGFDPRILEQLTNGAPIDYSNPQSLFDNLSPNLPKPAGFPSPEKVRKETKEHSSRIFENWNTLNQLIQRYETTIQKRWLNKSRQQRKKILLSAWPQMPAQHRPDLEAFFREQGGPMQSVEGYKWPYINQEDLLKPKLLLIYLNARARHPPPVFAGADRDSVRFAFTAGKMAPAFLNEYTMMFTGRNTPEAYGELISWDDHEDAADWLFSQRGMHPGEGLQVLEIQELLYGFLLACCRDIMHDVSEEDLRLGSAPIQPEPPALSTAEPGIDSLAAVAAEAPYRVPAHLNLRRLQQLIAARRSAAEDHIWALREDPGYFADVVLDMKEHRQEVVLDLAGQRHPLMRPYTTRKFWERVMGNLLTDAYFVLVIWDDLHSQITHIQSLTEKYAGKITPDDDLPPELLDRFLELHFSLEHYVEGPITNLKMNAPPSPPLRPYFVRQPDGGDPNKILMMSRPGVSKDKPTERLMWALRTLWDHQQLHLAGLDTIMDELERLMQDEPKARGLLSSRVSGMISDLSILSECRHQVSLYQPWASMFENQAAEREDQLKEDYTQRTTVLQQLMGGISETPLAIAGDPSDGKFFYPADKRKTRENTEAMQAAERNLDEFWAKVDAQLIHRTKLHSHHALRNLLSDQRILRRTPDWAEADSTRSANQRVDHIEDLCRPLSQIYFELEHRTQKTLRGEKTPVGKKTKTKTRGVPHPVEAPADGAAQNVDTGPSPDIQPTFTVDKRAHKVFSTLFYKPSRTAQPGEILWNDFLHAMSVTGFAIEKLYGSVWQFSPSKLDVERTIQFHEPHPVAKIPFRMMRRFGRRLARAYGWHGDMFKLDNE